MGLFDKLLKKEKKTVDDLESKVFLNDINELIDNNFNVMFIPIFDIFEGQEKFKLKYQYDNAHKYICVNNHYDYSNFDTKYLIRSMRESKCVIIEMSDLGSFVFTNHLRDDLFLILQRYFKDVISYVFKGNETGAYFKILKNGKIVRKVASNLIMDGIENYPETRGIPCEYEIEKGKKWKIDGKATYKKDMLKDFTKQDVLELFNYYVGFEKFKNNNIVRIIIYNLNFDGKEL